MRVTQTQPAELGGGLAGAAPAATPTTSFAATLAETSKADALPKGPKGETTRAVEGHDYVEITSGPRNGMFINTSDNGRRGEAFVRIRKGDHDLHVYGTGKDRRVITVPHKDQGEETTRPVEGHPAFVEIVSGPRNGMYVNKTSNERSGEAFVLVKKDDRDLHIYGTGKDRRVFISWHKDEAAKAEPAGGEAQPASGGAAAPQL